MAKLSSELRGTPGGLRRGLMLYGSTAAMAAALMLAEGGLAPALAQEIGPRIVPTHAAQGDFIAPGPSPSPSFEFRSTELDIVNMRRDSVLNWTTYDNAPPGGAQGNSYVNFLPEGAELRFTGNGESFTAINRVFTTPDQAGAYRGIAIQGRVTSYLFGDGPNSVGPVGGNIWFYSPGGILATGTSSFSVGSLLLSASDLERNEFANSLSVNMIGVADPFASVILQRGAQVNLTQPSSSFAIFAPTIEQGGDVFVNGSVFYGSGETGRIDFLGNGSMSVGVHSGPQAGNEIRHLGTTTGPASLSTDDFSVYDPHIIEFRTGADVRVLLSGTLGYEGASSAALGLNGEIVLSAASVGTTGDLTLNSNVTIQAETVELNFADGDRLSMGADANGAYSLYVSAPNASLTAGRGSAVDIAGDVTFDWREFQPAVLQVSAEGGNPNDTPGGNISIGGNLILNASSGRQGSGSQQAGRIEVSIEDYASIDVGGNLSLLADAFATSDEGGITLATGGRATLTMTGESNLEVGDALTISAQALRADGNCECTPPSGSGVGGYAEFTATGGSILVGGELSVSASAEANASYGFDDAVLDATGGTAIVSLGGSTASFDSIFVDADAIGAESREIEPGGSALGGTATFSKGSGGSLATRQLVVTADARGGDGEGFDGEVYSRSDGGDAQGGIASITLEENAEGLSYLELSASARAGDGSDATEFSAGAGGDGGDALGGSATLLLFGADTNLANVSEGVIDVSARGGVGGDGEADFNQGPTAGDAGSGGSARGGSLGITTYDGAEFSWRFGFEATVQAGDGGNGGNQAANEGGLTTIGVGGDGGSAFGANVTITADGGVISGDLELNVESFAGGGGRDGFDVDGNFAGSGDSGVSTGGSISLITRDNGASRFEVGDARLYAGGDIAGGIGIFDLTTVSEAGMSFNSIYAQVNGTSISGDANFRMGVVSNPVSVSGTAQIEANSMSFEFADSGRLDVGGSVLLSSFGGDITISHADNPGFQSIHAAGQFDAYANGNYNASAGSVVASGDVAEIRATGSITAAETNSLSIVTMSAQGNVTVGNINAGSDVDLSAGRLDYENGTFYQPGGRVTVSGTVTSGDSVYVTAGGFAEFTASSSVSADSDIWVRTGDDIVVASGASLTSDIDPDLDLSIHLLAGDINVGQSDGDLLEPIGSPIASLVIGGTLNSNGASIYLSADAIDASGSTISTRNLYVDVTDAPVFGPFSNDGGLLPENCRQGSACLGTLSADGAVAIGLDSNSGLISLSTGLISFSGSTFDVRTLERLELSGGNFASSLVATQRIALESVNDAIALNDISLEAPTLRLRAATDLLGPTANLTGLNELEIQVGNDLTAGNIYAVNGLDDGSDTNTFTVPGDFSVTSLTYASGVDMRIVASGNLSLGTADPTGADIDLEADGSLYLGSTAVNSGAIRLVGESIEFNNLVASGLVGVIAGQGGILGVSEGGSQIDTAGAIELDSEGDVSVGELIAAAHVSIEGVAVSATALTAGGDLVIGADGAAVVGTWRADGNAYLSGASLELGVGSTGGEISASSPGDIGFASLEAGTDAYFAAEGSILGGDVSADGSLFILAGNIVLGEGAGTTGVTLITPGGVTFESLESSEGSISLDFVSGLSGTLIDAAGNVTITGGLLAVEEISAGGDLSADTFNIQSNILSAGGDMTLALEGGALIGEAVAGGDLSISAGNGISAESLVAGNALTVDTDTPAVITEAIAGADLMITASILQSTSLVAGNNIVVDAGAGATIEEAVAGGSFAFTGSELTAGNLEAGGALNVAVSILATIESFSSGGDASLFGRSLNLGFGSSGGNISAQAVEGPLSFVLLAADGDSSLSATGAVTGGGAVAGGTLAVAGGSVALNSASFSNGLSLTAQSGSLTGNGLYQGTGLVDLSAALGIAIGSVDTLGEIQMTAGAEARFVELRSRDGSVDITAGGAIIGSSAAATGSDSEGDDSVSLTAGGAITLDGAVTALNPASRAQDDFSAQAGGALTIVRGEAGRDLSFTAGAGTLSAADVSAGRDLSLTGPAVQLADGEVARNLTVTATEGDITGSGLTIAGGVVELNASGNVAIGSLSAFGGNLAVSGGGSIGFTDLFASGAIALSAGGAVTGAGLNATNGIVVSGASLALGDVAAGEGGANLQASNGGLAADSVTGAGLNAFASGSLAVGTVDVGGSAQLYGASVAFDTVNAGGSAFIESSGEIDGGAVSVGSFASIYAQDAITLTGLTASDAIVESSNGAVSASGISIENILVARGTALSLDAAGALVVDAEASSGPIAISSSGDLTVDAETGGDISLASTGGSVTITGIDFGEGSPGDFVGEGVSGGSTVTVSAANAISVLEDFSAGGALTMTAGGLVSLQAAASGQTIDIQGGDLAIGSEGSLGTANTQRISLASRNAINLGSGVTGGFAVDAGEFGRIRSGGDLMITALAGEGGGTGSLTVGSLTINAGSSGQIGASGILGLTAGNVLDVNGTLSVAQAGASTTMMLTGDVVDLDYANAQLSVLDAANTPTGRIIVDGRLITSLSAAAAADIVGKTPAEINTRLGQADTVREIGLFRTANLTLEGGDAILIQNSGGAAVDDRRGLNVGALTVAGRQDGGTLVIINGIVAGSTGIGAAQNVTVTGTISAGSTVNGCALSNIAGCLVVIEPEPPLIVAPESILLGTGDLIQSEEDEEDEVEDGVADGKNDAPPIDTTRIDDPAGLPMIDDPVTGAGNEDLWQQPDE